MRDTGEWLFKAGEKIFGFDPAIEMYQDGSCLVEMLIAPDGTMTVTHIKNWRADEKAQPFHSIYRATQDLGVAVSNGIAGLADEGDP